MSWVRIPVPGKDFFLQNDCSSVLVGLSDLVIGTKYKCELYQSLIVECAMSSQLKKCLAFLLSAMLTKNDLQQLHFMKD